MGVHVSSSSDADGVVDSRAFYDDRRRVGSSAMEDRGETCATRTAPGLAGE
jgi:hypothetical protein